ncbi:MAG: peptidase, partial [Porcipelethomonas sp.]
QKKILESEGTALAIKNVQNAKAEALERLNQAAPTETVLKYKAIEAFPKIADGKATKIIIPSEIQGIAGLAAGLQGVVTDKNPEQKPEN